MVFKIVLATVGSMLAVPIICGILGEPQSYFEQKGMERWAIGIGLTAGIIGAGTAISSDHWGG